MPTSNIWAHLTLQLVTALEMVPRLAQPGASLLPCPHPFMVEWWWQPMICWVNYVTTVLHVCSGRSQDVGNKGKGHTETIQLYDAEGGGDGEDKVWRWTAGTPPSDFMRRWGQWLAYYSKWSVTDQQQWDTHSLNSMLDFLHIQPHVPVAHHCIPTLSRTRCRMTSFSCSWSSKNPRTMSWRSRVHHPLINCQWLCPEARGKQQVNASNHSNYLPS